VWIYAANQYTLGIDESALTGLAVAGIIGSVGVSLVLTKAGLIRSPQQTGLVSAVWVAAWVICALIGLTIVNALGDTPSITSALAGWGHIDSSIASPIDTLFYSMCLGAVSALAGALGGGVMFWQLNRVTQPEPQ
jgi:hypothetical protein